MGTRYILIVECPRCGRTSEIERDQIVFFRQYRCPCGNISSLKELNRTEIDRLFEEDTNDYVAEGV